MHGPIRISISQIFFLAEKYPFTFSVSFNTSCQSSSCLFVHLSLFGNLNGTNSHGILYCRTEVISVAPSTFWLNSDTSWACDGAVGWGTALQARRSRFRFSMLSLEFFIDLFLPAALWLWGQLTRYQEYFLRGKDGWQSYYFYVPIALKSGSLNLLEPSGNVQACTWIAVPLPWDTNDGHLTGRRQALLCTCRLEIIEYL